MGFFVEKFEAIENRKKYVVYKHKPVPHYLLLFLILIGIVFIYIAPSLGKSLSRLALLMGITVLVVVFVLIVIKAIETRVGSFAIFKNKQIIKKGASTLSFSHPLETWIEK